MMKSVAPLEKEATRTEPRPGVWSAPPKPMRRSMRPLSPAWNIVWVVTIFPTLRGLLELWTGLKISDLLLDSFYVLVWAAFIVINIWRFFAALAARKPGKSELCPDGVDGYNVELAIVGGDPYRAMDRGVAWFEAGLLHFNGEATSFVLAPEDLIAQPIFQLSRDPGVSRDALFLNIRSPWAFIRLLPLLGLRGLRFRMELRRFLKSTGPIGKSRQWPPLSRQPVIAETSTFRTAEEIGAAAAETGRAQGVLRA